MIKQAIILAGGLGTRLQHMVPNLPKPMADINGKPFLSYLFDYLIQQKIERVILSAGYKSHAIHDFFYNRYKSLELVYAIEEEPLGTGGGIKNALSFATEDIVGIFNGDTFFPVSLNLLYEFHVKHKADLTIALKPLRNFDRYGTVEMESRHQISGFKEKEPRKAGYINGGIYITDKHIFDGLDLPPIFSFEKDFLEKQYHHKAFYGFPADNYFIDIGIPNDYEKAKREFKEFKH